MPDEEYTSDFAEKPHSPKQKKLNPYIVGTACIVLFAVIVAVAFIFIVAPMFAAYTGESDVVGLTVNVKPGENVEVIFTGGTGLEDLEGVYAYFDGNAPLPPYDLSPTLVVGKMVTYHFAPELKGKSGSFEIFGKFNNSDPKLLYSEAITMS